MFQHVCLGEPEVSSGKPGDGQVFGFLMKFQSSIKDFVYQIHSTAITIRDKDIPLKIS